MFELEYSKEVKSALKEKRPVVALESTIIAHGMPYPQNVETALNVQKIIRDNGVTPATIAIIQGKVKVGLTDDEIDYLGKSGRSVAKISRRDIAPAVVKGIDGATTVSGTMLVAHLAGIDVFATGGIGGVHRGATTTMDVSADLDELSRTPVLVVCAGAKAILDLALTKEYLETKGVTVCGYRTDKLPAFYTRTSNLSVDYNIENPKQMADIFAVSKMLKQNNGFLLTVPIPEEYSLDQGYIEKFIDEALLDAEKEGVKGKEVTPYLLAKIAQLTQGKSLDANIHLVYNNADVASKIAIELAKK